MQTGTRAFCGVIAISLIASGAAVAQEVLEEIVVSANKREQNLQDVGISVSAFSAEQLQNLGASRTTDIVQQVPGMHLTAFTTAFTTFSLRGVSQNNFQDNLEAPVAVYMDGVYIASMNGVNAQLFDMDRVEVLRGPQGTLFGRNATGGLIHFISHQPTDKEANGYVEVGGAEFNTYNFEGAFGGSFSDTVRGRIAGKYEKSDGYVKAAAGATGQTSDGADGYGLRALLQMDASDAVKLDFALKYSKDNKVPTGQYVISLAGFDPNTGLGRFTDAATNDPTVPGYPGPVNFDRAPISGSPWRHLSNENPYFNREVKSATATVTAKLGWAELVSITNWQKLDKFYIEDSAGGLFYFPYNTVVDDTQYSQEFRLSGEQDRLRWQVGAYYLHMTWDTFQSVAGSVITGGGTDQHRITTLGDIGSRNWSVFGQTEYDFAPKWTLVAGLRWSQDNKDLALSQFDEDPGAGVPSHLVFDVNSLGVPGIDKIDYGDWAGRLQVNFKPVDKQLLYLAFNRGIKGGNWSLDPLGVIAQTSPENLKHSQEVLKAYEFGWKAEFLDGKARFNSAIYYYDYNGYQAFSLTGLTPQVSNSDAKSHGGELEFTVVPTTGLELMVGAAFIDSKVDAVPVVFGGTKTAEFPSAPKTAINLLARYEWPMFGGKVAAQVDGQWNDKQFLEGTNSEVSSEPAYSVWNAHLSYATSEEKLKFEVYVRNFTNEAYRLYDLDLGLLGIVEQVFAPPRQVGALVSYHW
jgi:iron complex outermembrane recepter protein